MPPEVPTATMHLRLTRSAPGRLDISALTLQDSSSERPVAKHKAANTNQLFVPDIANIEFGPLGTFCDFCFDWCDGGSHLCVKCGAAVCHQPRPGGAGCIGHDSVSKDWQFLCPLCARKVDGRKRSLPYKVIGYGTRKKVKKAWPACIVHMTSDSMKDCYLKNLINVDLVAQYKQSSANHTGGPAGGIDTTLAEIMEAYLGKPFLRAMKMAALHARDDKSVEKTVKGDMPWCDTTPKARGGRRGLILVTCGPAMRVNHHFESLRTLVNDPDVLDHNTVVIVYRSYVEGQHMVESRQIGKHCLPYRALGHEFSVCATEGCDPALLDNRASSNNGKVRVICAKCGWTSTWVAIDMDNEYFLHANPTTAPMLFWTLLSPIHWPQQLFRGRHPSR
ncbi:hypothetical protein BDR04DRAFT_1123517 [Suillus decipiens]|nr:hypothetical protein BDR04DRAFT_1123517 [Suillus decipiens]